SSTYVTPVVDTSADNAQFAVHIVAGASSLTTAAAALHVYADTATPAPTEYIVNPSATDGAIDATQGNHYAYINTAVTSKGKLFVFMPGTGGIPLVYRLIVQAAANNGFHAIGLAYENDISVGDLCSGSTDHDCAGKVREERFSGQDVSTLVSVNPANGIQNRLNKALAYLAQQHPQDGWGQFLDNGGNVVWDHVRVSGHSQGGGAAGYIGKQRLVDQVCFFSSPADIDNVQLTLATWVTAPGVTPASRYFGFSHLRDGMIPWTLIQQQWPAFGMDAFGTFVDVDSVARPYNQSHMLSSNLNKPSWVTVPDADAYHAITVVDARTPLDVNGLPTYRQVWQYQCFL
ncbi:MAG: BPSS1187 family protein, partial [Burkholderiaceae bacterium]